MSAVLDLIVDATRDAMATAAVQLDAHLFGVDRTVMSTFDIKGMRIYMRELRRMTPEEIESAFCGFTADWWERLPDDVPPLTHGAALVGLDAWLPA